MVFFSPFILLQMFFILLQMSYSVGQFPFPVTKNRQTSPGGGKDKTKEAAKSCLIPISTSNPKEECSVDVPLVACSNYCSPTKKRCRYFFLLYSKSLFQHYDKNEVTLHVEKLFLKLINLGYDAQSLLIAIEFMKMSHLEAQNYLHIQNQFGCIALILFVCLFFILFCFVLLAHLFVFSHWTNILQPPLALPDVSKCRHYVLIALIMTLKIKLLTPQLQRGQLSNLQWVKDT